MGLVRRLGLVGAVMLGGAAAPGSAVFPAKVAAKYAQEPAAKGRLHTCRDQYQANKAANANGGLRWIQTGGGYYSACLKALQK
jgi:hypothetical protein